MRAIRSIILTKYYHGRVTCTVLARVYVVSLHLQAFKDYFEHVAVNS